MFSAFPIPKGLCPPAQHKGCEQRATLRKTCRSCSLLYPERMEITQPRVARNELPWVGGPLNLNPERVLSKALNRYSSGGEGWGDHFPHARPPIPLQF